tara:strand:- start:434 stop:1012 length:579 start_codon:yes stop_codon:yes gene_type:complete
MIYPSTLNLTVLQDSTFEQDLIITEAAKAATLNDATNVITSACHGLVAGDRIAFAVSGGRLPCGIQATENYFVLADGFTTGAFKISTSAGGTEVDFTILDTAATYEIGKVIDLTTYTFDADIRSGFGESLAGSLICTATSAIAGKLSLSLTAVTTAAFAAGAYVWDLKLKTASTSYFYAKGTFTVTATVSRD